MSYLLLETGDKIYIEDEGGFMLLETGYTRLAVVVSETALGGVSVSETALGGVTLTDSVI